MTNWGTENVPQITENKKILYSSKIVSLPNILRCRKVIGLKEPQLNKTTLDFEAAAAIFKSQVIDIKISITPDDAPSYVASHNTLCFK